jgi:hybrid cluster-associated redox disulfide protein
MLVTKQTTIEQIISSHPETMKFFNDLQMNCCSCFAVKFDTLENGALMHGMDVDDLIKRLNEFMSSFSSGFKSNNQN